ncbi:protein trichome birefringence-like 12 [Pyrus ussuriensis x Pyrus communis]|uniref:Protein trichome birefringence-like 12 n=1 Tax=Pyrus ussuriensis x Pyrus communis TaxID=2448454 RepID=A0A5N5I651_9ROSA|nr:protein trichome birefringence-like 12 [Pyrus ussuriensis x Pyrus communis]
MAYSTNLIPPFPLLLILPFHTPSPPTSLSKRIPIFPFYCVLHHINLARFLGRMRNMNAGFAGTHRMRIFWCPFLCILRPKQVACGDQDGLKGTYRVDVDIPANDWASISDFCDVLVFNTGHWYYSSLSANSPKLLINELIDLFLSFLKLWHKVLSLFIVRANQYYLLPIDMSYRFKVALENMVSYVQNKVPHKTLKIWRLQSPRHFYGGDWNQNDSCLFNKLIDKQQLNLWFDPNNNGPNKEERLLNRLIKGTLQGTDIQLLNLTQLSEFRAYAHPVIWLGQKDAVLVWGQNCVH